MALRLPPHKKKFGKNPEPYAAEAYDAATVALKAIEAAAKGGKAPSREDVAVAVRPAVAREKVIPDPDGLRLNSHSHLPSRLPCGERDA